MASASANLSSLKSSLADSAFEARVLREAGILAPMRPDKALKVGSTFLRWGASPATGVATAAIHHPHELAVIDERGSLTWERLQRRSNALAHSFAALGIGPGDGVGIMCRNHRGFLEATLATAKLGASALYLNTMFAGPQLVEVTRREGPKALVYDEEFAGLLDGVPDSVHRVAAWTEAGTGGADLTLEQLIGAGSDEDLKPPPEKPRFVILTSGTTGTPKGAQRSSPDGLFTLAALIDKIPFRSRMTMMIAAPLFHSWGFSHFIISLPTAATMVLRRRFDPEETLRAAQREDEHHAQGERRPEDREVVLAEDADVERFLKLFTEVPLDEIAKLAALKGAELNEAKQQLADAQAQSEEQARELAALGARVEQHFGRPQDVEWALVGERFALLQARAGRYDAAIEHLQSFLRRMPLHVEARTVLAATLPIALPGQRPIAAAGSPRKPQGKSAIDRGRHSRRALAGLFHATTGQDVGTATAVHRRGGSQPPDSTLEIDHRHAARHRLEGPDRRDARERARVGTARHVDRQRVTSERRRHVEVGEPARIADPRRRKLSLRHLRVAHTVRRRPQPERRHRLDQELAQLRRALLVAPVADPHQVALPLLLVNGEWPEDARIRRLVPDPRAPGPPVREVEVAQHAPVGQHAVVSGQIEAADGARPGAGDRAVVRIVEEQARPAVRATEGAEAGDHRRLVPLVDQDEVDAVEHGRRIEGGGVVEVHVERGVDRAHPAERRLALLAKQVLVAPGPYRLEDAHDMAARAELAHNAAEEVGVAVVPVREHRVAEQRQVHDRPPSAAPRGLGASARRAPIRAR